MRVPYNSELVRISEDDELFGPLLAMHSRATKQGFAVPGAFSAHAKNVEALGGGIAGAVGSMGAQIVKSGLQQSGPGSGTTSEEENPLAEEERALAQTAEVLEVRRAQAAASDAYALFSEEIKRKLYGDPESGMVGFYGEKGRETLDLVKRSTTVFHDTSDSFAAKLDEISAPIFRDKAKNLELSTMTSLARHEADERRIWQRQSRLQESDIEHQCAVASFTDMRQVNDALARQEEVLLRMYVEDDLPPEEIAAKVLATESGTLAAVFGKHVEAGNFDTARMLFDDWRLTDEDRLLMAERFRSGRLAAWKQEARKDPEGVLAKVEAARSAGAGLGQAPGGEMGADGEMSADGMGLGAATGPVPTDGSSPDVGLADAGLAGAGLIGADAAVESNFEPHMLDLNDADEREIRREAQNAIKARQKAERVKMEGYVRSSQAAFAKGEDMVLRPEEELIAALGEDGGKAAHAELVAAKSRAADVRAVRGMNPEEKAAWLAGIEAEERAAGDAPGMGEASGEVSGEALASGDASGDPLASGAATGDPLASGAATGDALASGASTGDAPVTGGQAEGAASGSESAHQESERLRQAREIVREDDEARAKDPVQYAIDNDHAVQEALAAMQENRGPEETQAYIAAVKAAKQRLGLPDDGLYLSNEMAEALALSFMEDGASAMEILSGLRTMAGDDYDALFGQLSATGKLPPAAEAMGRGKMSEAACRMLARAETPERWEEHARWFDKNQQDEVRAAVKAAAGDPKLASAAASLAMEYMMVGHGMEDAVRLGLADVGADGGKAQDGIAGGAAPGASAAEGSPGGIAAGGTPGSAADGAYPEVDLEAVHTQWKNAPKPGTLPTDVRSPSRGVGSEALGAELEKIEEEMARLEATLADDAGSPDSRQAVASRLAALQQAKAEKLTIMGREQAELESDLASPAETIEARYGEELQGLSGPERVRKRYEIQQREFGDIPHFIPRVMLPEEEAAFREAYESAGTAADRYALLRDMRASFGGREAGYALRELGLPAEMYILNASFGALSEESAVRFLESFSNPSYMLMKENRPDDWNRLRDAVEGSSLIAGIWEASGRSGYAFSDAEFTRMVTGLTDFISLEGDDAILGGSARGGGETRAVALPLDSPVSKEELKTLLPRLRELCLAEVDASPIRDYAKKVDKDTLRGGTWVQADGHIELVQDGTVVLDRWNNPVRIALTDLAAIRDGETTFEALREKSRQAGQVPVDTPFGIQSTAGRDQTAEYTPGFAEKSVTHYVGKGDPIGNFLTKQYQVQALEEINERAYGDTIPESEWVDGETIRQQQENPEMYYKYPDTVTKEGARYIDAMNRKIVNDAAFREEVSDAGGLDEKDIVGRAVIEALPGVLSGNPIKGLIATAKMGRKILTTERKEPKKRRKAE